MKIGASDYDGTLFRQRTIAAEDVEGVKAWQAAGGNVSRLANLLNVSRVTLYRYLKKYGLEKK